MACQTLTSAIDKLVHSLCLEYYPCGQEGWHKPHWSDEIISNESGVASYEDEMSTRLELLRSPLSPWREESSWSPQALALRELAVKTPHNLNSSFICSFFTTLRILDKKVTVIDKGLLRFDSLEELVLSANNLTELPTENLPKKLRILELYGNQISSLKSLKTCPPPPLQHLGLGNNCLGSPEDIQYFTADLWPQLMSLDLSWSGFTEQNVLVEALSGLPCLRSLVLEGSPLTLSPLYPGFALDSLFRLVYLDGTQVTPDTRHRVRGLAQLKDRVCTDAEVIVNVTKMRGIPNPAVLCDDLSEFPIISYSYSVSYEFLDRPQSQKNHFLQTEVEVQTLDNIPQNPKLHLFKTGGEDQSQVLGIPLVMNSTPKQGWAEVIELNYSSTHRVSNLVALKNFFLRGLWLTVEEEKILSWPAPPAEGTVIKASADKKGKDSKDKGQKSKDKKKKESVLNLIQEAPVTQTIGVVHVQLKDLLEGKDKVGLQCELGVLFTEQTIKTAVTSEKEQTKKTKEDKKEDKKGRPSGETSQRNAASSKGKDKGKKESETGPPADENPPKMEHLTVEFSSSSVLTETLLKLINLF